MLKPGPSLHLALQEKLEELVKSSSKSVVALREMEVGDRHILAVAGHVDVLAPFGNIPVGQVAFESARLGHALKAVTHSQRVLVPRTDLVDMVKIQVAVR